MQRLHRCLDSGTFRVSSRQYAPMHHAVLVHCRGIKTVRTSARYYTVYIMIFIGAILLSHQEIRQNSKTTLASVDTAELITAVQSPTVPSFDTVLDTSPEMYVGFTTQFTEEVQST